MSAPFQFLGLAEVRSGRHLCHAKNVVHRQVEREIRECEYGVACAHTEPHGDARHRAPRAPPGKGAAGWDPVTKDAVRPSRTRPSPGIWVLPSTP